MSLLQGYSAVITGGGSGLGRAVTERYISEGASVVILDKSVDKLEEIKGQFGSSVAVVQGDVRNLEDHHRAVSEAVSSFGKIDVVVSNAGIWDWNTELYDLDETALDTAFSEMFEINVKGGLFAAKASMKELAKSRGSMIYTLSNAAYHVGGGGPIYTATKHALVGLLKELAYELAPVIRVNGVAPSAVASDLRGPGALGLGEQSLVNIDLNAMMENCLPINSLPEPFDYTGAYVFLASRKDSSTMTGEVIKSDCGFGIKGLKENFTESAVLDRLDIS